MWDLWWTEWHWGRFFSEFFSSPPVGIIPPWLCILIYHLEMNDRPLVVQFRDSLTPIDINNKESKI
jgi:hypothetical protein